MEAFTSNRSMVDINETAKGSAEIVPSLIAVHALLGCDNVPKMFDIGKKKRDINYWRMFKVCGSLLWLQKRIEFNQS